MDARLVAKRDLTLLTPVNQPNPSRGELHGCADSSFPTLLARARAAADAACRRLGDEVPERALWRAQGERLVQELQQVLRDAETGVGRMITEQLADIVESSRDDLELLRRAIILARHARDYATLCADLRVPDEVRERARTLGFALFDQVARAHRDPAIERFAARRNAIFVELGIPPRSTTLLDWCDAAVRIALGALLRTLSPAQSERLLAAKVRFDLLAIELNIALDDLADNGRDAPLFALTVHRVFGPTLGSEVFCGATATGQYFRDRLTHAQARLGDQPSASTRYLELVEALYREVVSAGRALAGERWDETIWIEQMRRVLGAMMLSLVQNQRPDLLNPRAAKVDWSRDFHGTDQLSIQAANGNRVVLELVGMWCYERVTGRCLDFAARARLLTVFEDLQIAQQLGNCLATLERELDEGDRSNCIIDRAAETWRAMSVAQRVDLVREPGLLRSLHALSVPVATDGIIDVLFEILRRRGPDQERALAFACLSALIDRSSAPRDVLEQWRVRVDAAAQGLDALGLCGVTSKQAQVDLLLLHLLLLKKSPLSDCGERH